MIASLSGTLRRKGADYLVVDVGGVGYQVSVPLSILGRLPDTGEEISLHIHTHVREDSLSLFGFMNESEKELFLLLMGVSGIGPKLALAVLSSLPVRELTQAIQMGDDAKLFAIPGIGKKTAARMTLELKDKVKHLAPDALPQAGGVSSHGTQQLEDAASALVNLGFKRPLAEDVIKRIHQLHPEMRVEDLIREALSALMKR